MIRVRIPVDAFTPSAYALEGLQSSVLSLQYRRKLEKIVNSVSKINSETIVKFLENELVKRGLSEARRLKYTRMIKIILDLMEKPLKNLEYSDAETIFFWLKNNTRLSDDTKKDYWNMFRIFIEWTNPDIGVRKFKLKVRPKRKLPSDILSEEEMGKIISAAWNIRDRALISLTYHGALRSGEIRSLRVKDLIFDQYGAVVMVPEEGKTGSRRIRIIEPVPILAQYMQDHKFKDDPNAPLFYRMDKKTRTFLNSASLNNIIKQYAMKAGIRKRVHTHLLRHSKATELAKKLTSQELMVYGGWRKLTTVQIYTHLSGADIEKKILEIHNIKTNEHDHKEEKILEPKKCVRCEFQNDAGSKFCSRCGMLINLDNKLLD